MKRLTLLALFAPLAACTTDSTTIKATAPTEPVQADGQTPAVIVATVMNGSNAVTGGAVTFTSSAGKFAPTDPNSTDTSGDTTSVTIVGGSAETKLYSATSGVVRVDVSWSDPNGGTPLTAMVTITFGNLSSQVASITFISAVPETIGLRGSGNEVSKVTFQCKDAKGSPVPDNVSVNFTVAQELGGASVSPASAKTSGGQGMVFTNLSAGTAIGSEKVIASIANVSAPSNPITISGAPANYNNFTFSCETRIMQGMDIDNLWQYCVSIVADRNRQKIPNTQVTFISEAGVVDKYVTTEETGTAISIFRTGNPRPATVPASNAFFASLQGIGNLFNWSPAAAEPVSSGGHPRNEVITLIAATSGEESCFGTPGIQDGRCLCGSVPCEACKNGSKVNCFEDLPEPFVDANDDGTWNTGENNIDVNNNRQWDGPNGQWDGQTIIWRPYRVVWSAAPVFSNTLSYFASDGSGTPMTSLSIPLCGTKDIYFRFVDSNLNWTAGASVSATGSGNASIASGPAIPFGEPLTNYIGWGYFVVTVSNLDCPGVGIPPNPVYSKITVSLVGQPDTRSEWTIDKYTWSMTIGGIF
jgi:adhesin/invasin